MKGEGWSWANLEIISWIIRLVEIWDVLICRVSFSLGLVLEDSLRMLLRDSLVLVPVVLFLLLDHTITGNKEVIIPSDHFQEAKVCVGAFISAGVKAFLIIKLLRIIEG